MVDKYCRRVHLQVLSHIISGSALNASRIPPKRAASHVASDGEVQCTIFS